MNISIVNESKQKTGGGFSFIDNFTKGFKKYHSGVIDNWKEADTILIPSASMISKELFRSIKETGKKLILRVDNALRNSRNRGAGMNRMKEMAQGADLIVYQSQWAKNYLSSFLSSNAKEVIIHNSVDGKIFKPEGAKIAFPAGKTVYLYSRFNRDETKHWEVAWYEYQMIQRKNPNALLAIVGQFSDELRQYNFDFYNDEQYQYLGVYDEAEMMARLYRGCSYFLATYYNDCFSNSYIEALLCGCKPFAIDMSGGTPELLDKWLKEGSEYYALKRMVDEYKYYIESL